MEAAGIDPRRGLVADEAEGATDLLGEWLSEFAAPDCHEVDLGVE